MPYVNIKITREGATREQKAELIAGVTDLLVKVLNKSPATTFVVVDEVQMEDWGVGGLPVEEYRRSLAGRDQGHRSTARIALDHPLAEGPAAAGQLGRASRPPMVRADANDQASNAALLSLNNTGLQM